MEKEGEEDEEFLGTMTRTRAMRRRRRRMRRNIREG